jgi:serine/threonine protein kinase
VLGEGSSAKVYAAKHLGTGEEFAIKWIDKGGDMNDDESMKAELAILRRLHHKNIVNLHEVYESESTLWLVMEKVGGGELLGYLKELDHLSEAYVRDIAKQLCTGLHYVHGAGVVHRDMKLENVLRATTAPDACVKIAEFGLAAILPRFEQHKFEVDASVKRKSSDMLNDLWGTPQYFAPELIAEAYGTQVDMWSLGCVLYELLSGHKLFGAGIKNISKYFSDGKVEAALHKEIQAGPTAATFKKDKWDPKISEDCADFIRGLCTVDPAERLSAGEALSHPWMTDDENSAAATHHMKAAHAKLKKAAAAAKKTAKK